jgi:hypothetical protein
MRKWRRIDKISWRNHVRNEEVLRRVVEKRLMIHTIRERQRRWIGHTLRGDSILRIVMEWKLEGKRTRGRPRRKLMDWTMKDGYQKRQEKTQH